MKKKILCIFMLGLILLNSDGAKAGQQANTLCKGSANLNKMTDNGETTEHWNITVNGSKAFCLDKNKPLKPGWKCSENPSGSLSRINPADTRIAAYYKSYNANDSSTWNYVNSPDSGLSAGQQEDIYIALSRGDYSEVQNIVNDGAPLGNSNGNLANNIISEYNSTPIPSGNDTVILFCNGDTDGTSAQRLLASKSGLGCDPDPEQNDPNWAACTDGQMNLNNPNTSCYQKFYGIETYYSYTAGGGGNKMVHSNYGEDQGLGNAVGDY